MRHKKHLKKFHRNEEERKRLWIDLCTALILNKKIETFSVRGKWFRARFDRLVTLCKRAKGDTKLAFSNVRPFLSEKAARELIENIVPKLLDREGGYTSQLKLFKPFQTSGFSRSYIRIIGFEA